MNQTTYTSMEVQELPSTKKQNDVSAKESFFSGVMVLTLSNILVKALGMLFKIPMNYIIGDTGMGYYNAAYTIYTFFYMLSTAGLPTAVSILVSASLVAGKQNQCRRILHTSLGLFCVIGCAGTAVMFWGAEKFASFIGAPPAAHCILAVSPTLFFVCIASALRGYFQGFSRMGPTAVSQLLEAVFKVAAGVLCALYAMKQGYSIAIVAAYAVLGLTLGAAISMLYLVCMNFRVQSIVPHMTADSDCESRRRILVHLAAIALPITVSSSVMSLTNMIDAVLIQRLLQVAGMTQQAATALYGNYTSLAVPLFNLPPILVYPIAYAIVPLLSQYRTMAQKGMEAVRNCVLSSLRIAFLLSAPCAVGLAVLSEPILHLLFRSSSANIAAPLLTLLAPSCMLLCVLAVTNSVLQSINKATLPVYSMLAGGGVKIISSLVLIPLWGMAATPIGTFLCYLTASAMNLYFVIRYTGITIVPIAFFGKPMIAVGGCGLSAWLACQLLRVFLSEKIAVLPAIGIAGCVYVFLVIRMRILQQEDVMMLPGGEKWKKLFHLADGHNTGI